MTWIVLKSTAFPLANAQSGMDAEVYDSTATCCLQGSPMQQLPPAISCVAGVERFRTVNPDTVNRRLYSLLKTFKRI